MIACDLCWTVLCKVKDFEAPLGKRLFEIGRWELCKECVKRYDELIFEDVKSGEFRKN